VEYDSTDSRVGTLVTGLVLGAVIGAGIALLAAPESGRRTRRRIRRSTGKLRGGAGDRWEEFAEDVRGRVDEAVRAASKRLQSR